MFTSRPHYLQYLIALIVLAVLGTACSSDPTSEPSPAAETLDWVVTLLNADSPDIAEVEARCSPNFLAIVPVEQIVGLLVGQINENLIENQVRFYSFYSS